MNGRVVARLCRRYFLPAGRHVMPALSPAANQAMAAHIAAVGVLRVLEELIPGFATLCEAAALQLPAYATAHAAIVELPACLATCALSFRWAAMLHML